MVILVSDSDEKAGVRSRVTDGINPASNELEKIPKAAALSDESQNGKFPRVVARGSGTFAEQILEIAWSNNIKVREDADLAEVLTAIDVDSEIPIEAFAAVAEILSYVYRANAGLIQNDDEEKTNPWLTKISILKIIQDISNF